MTADEFAAARHTLPEQGRWTELVAGVPFRHDEPDDVHGTVVLNLSRALGELVTPDAPPGFAAAFDVGVVTARDPDTVRFPAVSLFRRDEPAAGVPGLFDEVGVVLASRVPEVVVEVVSTPSRRRDCAARIAELHDAGVRAVWVADPDDDALTVAAADDPPTIYAGDETPADPLVPGWPTPVADLFAPPAWWSG